MRVMVGPFLSHREWKSWFIHPGIDPQKSRMVSSFLLPSIFRKYSFYFLSVAHFEFSKNSSMIAVMVVGAGCG
jgi:hypothetical protein